MKKNLILASLLFMLSGLLASLTSFNAFATDVVPSGANASGWNANPQVNCNIYWSSTSQVWSGWANFCAVGSGSANVGVRAISFRDSSGGNIWAYSGDYIQIQIGLTSSDTQYQPQIYYLPDDNANVEMISMKIDGSFTASEGKELVITYYAKYLGANNPSELIIGSASGREFLSWNTNSYIISGMSVSAWHVENQSLTQLEVTNAINNSAQIQGINRGIESLNSTMSDLSDNEGRVADVAEDEYNQTQEDRENASSDANGFSFNFSLPNPFSLFQVSDGCVNTPVIDSWLHLEGDWKSPHCPVFPANVRSALTPVLSLLISLACLMVVIRWVSSSSSDVANGINTVVKSEKGGKS